MKKKILPFLLFILFFPYIFSQNSSPRPVQKQTFTYAEKEGIVLKMDKYDAPFISGEKPCILFVFGGGFVGGERDGEHYLDYFDFLANEGYVVISIDYRLGLQGITNPTEFPTALELSINMAVEDLLDATTFILQNTGIWNINPDMIVACGSSAGAITVLHAENVLSNREGTFSRVPDEFSYAGIIAAAGALFSSEGGITWKNPPAPLLLFHGDADERVPFGKIEFMQFGAYGSGDIARQFHTMQFPYYFYEVVNAGHEIAGDAFYHNREEILSFLDKFVKEKRQLFMHTKEEQIGRPKMKKDFTMEDFIRNSF